MHTLQRQQGRHWTCGIHLPAGIGRTPHVIELQVCLQALRPWFRIRLSPFPYLARHMPPYTGTHLHLQVVIMALIVGSLFSGQSHDPADARNFFGVAFLAIMFLSMGAMPELGITFGTKP